jgi:hypothetical protein
MTTWGRTAPVLSAKLLSDARPAAPEAVRACLAALASL